MKTDRDVLCEHIAESKTALNSVKRDMETGSIYSHEAVARARQDALDWLLSEDGHGYPKAWGHLPPYYDEEAPPIAGYEALEREGVVVRLGLVTGGTRVHFTLSDNFQQALARLEQIR